MSNLKFSSASYADTKPHYHILDGLRGAAALMVVWYHVFEGFAFAEGSAIDVFNHGYLAVDFFFMLSGFVTVMLTMTVGTRCRWATSLSVVWCVCIL